jgi:multiple sugar transport system permease protein
VLANSKSERLQRIVLFFIVLFGAVIMMYPLIWMLASSFKPEQEIFRNLGLWSDNFTFENYIKGWQGVAGIGFSRYFVNSIIVVTLNVIGNIVTCSMTAYAFARLNFSFKGIFFGMMMATVMLPHHVTLIPRYIIFDRLGWINTFLPLTVPAFFATQSFFIFLLVQFMRGIPKELDDAAIVDGCTPWQIYWKIIMPLSVPALVTTTLFTFIWTWNDFFGPLIYLQSPIKYTVALGLRSFADATSQSAYGQLFAMSIVSLVPVFIFFVFFQRLLIEGIATTGLKG